MLLPRAFLIIAIPSYGLFPVWAATPNDPPVTPWHFSSNAHVDRSYNRRRVAVEERDSDEEDMRLVRDTGKVTEKYGSCKGAGNKHCLWYKIRVRNWRMPQRRCPISSNMSQKQRIIVLKRDPRFLDDLMRRIDFVVEAKKYTKIMERKMKRLLRMYERHSPEFLLPSSSSPVVSENDKVLQYLDQAERRRYRRRMLKHQHLCHARTVRLLRDVELVIKRMRKKYLSYQEMMESWLKMNYRQKKQLYRILLYSQRRDMEKQLRLRSLQLWYNRKLYLLNLQTKRRLQQIIVALKMQEQRSQQMLWHRLEHLQASADEWTKHELSYKEALLNMSVQQKYLLRQNKRLGCRVAHLTNLLALKILPIEQQLLMASRENLHKLSELKRSQAQTAQITQAQCSSMQTVRAVQTAPCQCNSMAAAQNTSGQSKSQTTVRRESSVEKSSPSCSCHNSGSDTISNFSRSISAEKKFFKSLTVKCPRVQPINKDQVKRQLCTLRRRQRDMLQRQRRLRKIRNRQKCKAQCESMNMLRHKLIKPLSDEDGGDDSDEMSPRTFYNGGKRVKRVNMWSSFGGDILDAKNN